MDFWDISYEEIFELPETKTKYIQIDCSHNKVKNTSGLQEQTLLQSLDISYNLIKEISGWNFLSNLTVVNLSHNSLISIQGLHQCYKLTTIQLQFNHLKSLTGLETLRNLQYLNISNNSLADKNEIRRLSLNRKLEVLYLEGNSITSYRQICYSVILSLTILDGQPTPGRARRGSVKDSYRLRMLTSVKY